LFLLLLLKAPGVETFFLLSNLVVVGLDAGLVFLDQPVQFRLDFGVVAFLGSLEIVQRFLLHALESIESPVTPDCISMTSSIFTPAASSAKRTEFFFTSAGSARTRSLASMSAIFVIV